VGLHHLALTAPNHHAPHQLLTDQNVAIIMPLAVRNDSSPKFSGTADIFSSFSGKSEDGTELFPFRKAVKSFWKLTSAFVPFPCNFLKWAQLEVCCFIFDKNKQHVEGDEKKILPYKW
jgi:hypothetical protein